MNFKQLRKENGYKKQKDFAKTIDENVSTVSMWETGRSRPKTADLPKISEALGVSVEEIVNCFK